MFMYFCLFAYMQTKSRSHLSVCRLSVSPHVRSFQPSDRSEPKLGGCLLSRVLIISQNTPCSLGHKYHWSYCCKLTGSISAFAYSLLPTSYGCKCCMLPSIFRLQKCTIHSFGVLRHLFYFFWKKNKVVGSIAKNARKVASFSDSAC